MLNEDVAIEMWASGIVRHSGTKIQKPQFLFMNKHLQYALNN